MRMTRCVCVCRERERERARICVIVFCVCVCACLCVRVCMYFLSVYVCVKRLTCNARVDVYVV